MTQKDNPTRGDCVKLVAEDLEMIKEDFNEDNIHKLAKQDFMNHIINRMKTETFR